MNWGKIKALLLDRQRFFGASFIMVILSFAYTIYAFHCNYVHNYDLSMACLIFALSLCLYTVVPKYYELMALITWISASNLKDEILGDYNRVYIGEYLLFLTLIIMYINKLIKKRLGK